MFFLGIYHRDKRLTNVPNESRDTLIAKFSGLCVPHQPLHWQPWSIWSIRALPVALVAWLSLSTFPSTPLNLRSQVPWLDFSFMNSLSATSQRGHIYNSLLCATPLPLINQIFTNASNCLSPALMFLGLKILNSSATQIVIPTIHTSHGGGGAELVTELQPCAT